jgi:biotin carboxylase
VVLVVPARSYRTLDFVSAARGLRLDLIVASDADVPMTDLGRSRTLTIDFERPEWSAGRIAGLKEAPDAVVAGDDRGVIIAAMASHLLNIPSNPVSAVSMTRDKAHMRGLLASAGVPQPPFSLAGHGEVEAKAAAIGYPCVVKPRGLSASVGVIRIDSPSEARYAEGRIRRIIAESGGDQDATLLVESFMAGVEVAVEGMVTDGAFEVLAILDKPDPLDGPFFEETLFVTPSRLSLEIQDEITEVVRLAVGALGLVSGPIHAEVRHGSEGAVLIEVAARSIGGLCGRALTFGLLGESLESLIIRSALGMSGVSTEVSASATGVMMLPIPRPGILDTIDGIDEALSVEGVSAVEQAIAPGRPVVPLPEGDRYLGFIFADGATADDVESSLRAAADALDVRIV